MNISIGLCSLRRTKLKKASKESTEIFDELINVIENPDGNSEGTKKILVATLKIIQGRITFKNEELFMANVSKSEYNKFIKHIFAGCNDGVLSAKLKKEYEGGIK